MLDLSHYVPNDIILELLLPYMFFLVTDPIPRVRAKSITTITRCIQLVTVLPKNEANIFPEYILPNLVSFFAIAVIYFWVKFFCDPSIFICLCMDKYVYVPLILKGCGVGVVCGWVGWEGVGFQIMCFTMAFWLLTPWQGVRFLLFRFSCYLGVFDQEKQEM